ncbi:DUF5666 domain-containing protein [Streptomyces parvus]|uniref:DUF5666 domain-containing protein n=1 Tax=Streptomyces parvus TaxID=66428 RepID=A0A5D4JNR4_9ACTN|nr:DUF5666 domain-containing protein [Streptomyces parvus]TYR65283.1 hypothetical protein FY004_06990 [Streptomyces parvus]
MSRHEQPSAPKGSRRSIQTGLPDELLTAAHHQDDLDEELADKRQGPGKLTLVLGAAILAVCGIAGGIAIEKAMTSEPTARSQAGGRTGGTGESSEQRGGEGGRAGSGGGSVIGTVERIDDGTVHVKTSDGQTVKVKTTGDTRVQVTKEGSPEDLASGQTVAVSGERAEDGSLSATVISQGSPARGAGRGGPARNENQEDPS